MQNDRISWRGGADSTENQNHPSTVDHLEAAELSDLMDEKLRMLMRGKKLAWLQQARAVLAARAEDNHL